MTHVLYDSYKNINKVVSYLMKEIFDEKYVDVKMFYNKMETSFAKSEMETSKKNMMEIDYYSDNRDIKRLILENLLILQS